MQAAVELNLSTSYLMLVDKEMCLLLPMELKMGRLREIWVNFNCSHISIYYLRCLYVYILDKVVLNPLPHPK